MIGLGKKDEDGKRVRIEHRGLCVPRSIRSPCLVATLLQQGGSVNVAITTSSIRQPPYMNSGARIKLWRELPAGTVFGEDPLLQRLLSV